MILFFGCISQSPSEPLDKQSTKENITQPLVTAPDQNETKIEEPEIQFLEEAKAFARSTSTYMFDGSGLEFINYSNGKYSFRFDSRNSGYGNRSDNYQDGNITAHTLLLEHNGTSFFVALVDSLYDEIHSILLTKTCPPEYRKYEWENGTFCYKPTETDGMPCAFSKQCEKGLCKSRSDGKMGPRGICFDFTYGCHSWLFDQTVTRVDICKEKDYPK